MKTTKSPFLFLTLVATLASAAEFHVAKNGSDEHSGSYKNPFLTIQAAADVAQPGDTITVHEGVYRESINPPRGGLSDDLRIIYRTAEGEKVTIKGSEVIKGWKKQTDECWIITLANDFFGDYNPYQDVIAGDWFTPQGRVHHTGEVYLNGNALFEEVSCEQLKMKPLSWYCEVDENETRIWANFGTSNPNHETIEINVRPTCFYPEKPGNDYITVSGFVIQHGATQWAPPTAEQVALIGTHWSKGWIIENNVISDSKCVGLTLGKYGDEQDNSSGNSAGGYVDTIKNALKLGWSKETIGWHIIRDNTIYNCGAAGICGSLGGAFSQVTGNHIYNINIDKPFTGHEMAGIKFHAPIDMLIQGNRIHHTSRGIWLDWMTQGTRVTGNLLYENGRQDLYIEVNHGPYTVDNNIFLTPYSLKDRSQGGSFSHNYFAGKIDFKPDGRQTPYHPEHSTEIAGMSKIHGGDNRFYNNIIAGTNGLADYHDAEFPTFAGGNIYAASSQLLENETGSITIVDSELKIELIEKGEAVSLHIKIPNEMMSQQNELITTQLLGITQVSGHAFLNPNGSAYCVDSDYLGEPRSPENTVAGPFELHGTNEFTFKVW